MDPFAKTSAEACFGKVYRHKAVEKKELNREYKVFENVQHNNVVKQEATALDMHHRLFARSPDFDDFAGRALVNRFPPMHLAAQSPGKMVVNRHEAEFKQVVMRDGKLVHYEHMKVKKVEPRKMNRVQVVGVK